jgi:hypothetical protein
MGRTDPSLEAAGEDRKVLRRPEVVDWGRNDLRRPEVVDWGRRDLQRSEVVGQGRREHDDILAGAMHSLVALRLWKAANNTRQAGH